MRATGLARRTDAAFYFEVMGTYRLVEWQSGCVEVLKDNDGESVRSGK